MYIESGLSLEPRTCQIGCSSQPLYSGNPLSLLSTELQVAHHTHPIFTWNSNSGPQLLAVMHQVPPHPQSLLIALVNPSPVSILTPSQWPLCFTHHCLGSQALLCPSRHEQTSFLRQPIKEQLQTNPAQWANESNGPAHLEGWDDPQKIPKFPIQYR